MSLLSLQDVTLRFAGPPVLDGVTLRIEAGERIGLVGRNGAGKSTLMRLMHGDIRPDSGDVSGQQGLSVAMLAQEVPSELTGSVFEEVARGLGETAELLSAFHDAIARYAHSHEPALRAQLDRLERSIESRSGWQMQQQVEQILSRMDLAGQVRCGDLSAGMKRRVLLARALVQRPDILLLDEPTNHLDIEAISWLEEFLSAGGQTFVLVTHDRMFLRKLATRIVEIDRGRLTSWSCGHATYLERKNATLEAEAQQQALFDKRLAQEEAWIRTGIKARRTRNEGRVRALEKLRETRQARRERLGEVRMQAANAERSGRLVIEAQDITFSYSAEMPSVVRNFSSVIMRGDKVGIVGANGAGKTTVLRLLLGELPSQTGELRHGTRLEIAYFDQLHALLDDEKSLIDNVANGADRITVGGRSRHVIGYLSDFLFAPEQARQPVKNLSGGERNRLLLARLFAKPSNVLVLDEPTNDLDLETLELLEELLSEYQGTVLLVSHDREFLNNVITTTLALEGNGEIKEYAGGYDDWLRQRKPPAEDPVATRSRPSQTARARTAPDRRRKLSFAERRELESLPDAIATLEAQQQQLHEKLGDPAFYRQDGTVIAQTKAQLSAIETELTKAYARWEEMEQLQ